MPMTATKSPRTAVKRQMEVQALVEWAFREELPKRQLSSAEGIWRDIAIGAFGKADTGSHATSAQRYADFGVPHPDAKLIEDAVADLPMMVIDWAESLPAIMGDLAGLLTVNDLQREQEERGRITQSSWPAKTYSKTQRRAQATNTPRDVIFLGSLDMGALVASHACQGTRPRWYGQPVTCFNTPSRNNPDLPMTIGECRAKDLYTTGSCCPLKWGIKDPKDKYGDWIVTPFSIATARADYLAWWRGMAMLAETMHLSEHTALPPAAQRLPWFDGEPCRSVFRQAPPPKMPTLPMKPQRETAGPTRGQGEDVPRRHVGRRVAP